MSKRILIVDDTTFMRVFMRKTLAGLGHVIVGEAADGAAAIAIYRQKQPDIVILNIVMPGMDGLTALKELREWDPNAKVIICSAMGQASTVFSVIRAGATGFLAKPFTEKQLIESVQKIISADYAESQM